MIKIAKGIGIVAGAGLFAVGGAYTSVNMVEPQTIEVIKNVTVEVPVEVIKEVSVEVIKEIEVFVDNGDMEATLIALEDREIIDDASTIVDEIKQEDAAFALAVAEIEADYADALEDADLVDDEDDAKLIKIYTDFEDYTVVDSDYDDNEYTFDIEAKYRDNDTDTKAKAIFTVTVEDGRADIDDVVEA